MTIEEAIIHAREVAESRNDICAECREEHQQLAEWLEELKVKRKMLDDKILFNGIKNYYFEKGYNKAIDDFVAYASTMPIVEDEDGYKRPMHLEEIAEQLKDVERMTIDEAIERLKRYVNDEARLGYVEFAEFYSQIIKLLEELKAIREKEWMKKLDAIYNAINDYLEASKITKMDDIFEMKYKIFDVLLDCLACYSQENVEDE